MAQLPTCLRSRIGTCASSSFPCPCRRAMICFRPLLWYLVAIGVASTVFQPSGGLHVSEHPAAHHHHALHQSSKKKETAQNGAALETSEDFLPVESASEKATSARSRIIEDEPGSDEELAEELPNLPLGVEKLDPAHSDDKKKATPTVARTTYPDVKNLLVHLARQDDRHIDDAKKNRGQPLPKENENHAFNDTHHSGEEQGGKGETKQGQEAVSQDAEKAHHRHEQKDDVKSAEKGNSNDTKTNGADLREISKHTNPKEESGGKKVEGGEEKGQAGKQNGGGSNAMKHGGKEQESGGGSTGSQDNPEKDKESSEKNAGGEEKAKKPSESQDKGDKKKDVVLEQALAPHLKIPKEQTKEFLDTHKVAESFRKMVGIKKASSLHLERKKLIKKGCDFSTFGPSVCAVNSEAERLLWLLENRKNTTLLVIGLVILLFGIVVQTLLRVVEKKILEGKDAFSKDLMETAFRQIATISIVNVILWGVMQSNLAEILDELVFGDVLPKERDADQVLGTVSPVLEGLFESLFFVSVLLLVWYVLFVIYLQLVIRRLVNWMRKTDEADVTVVARECEKAAKSHCCSSFLSSSVAKSNFVALRYEFSDNVQAMSIPGVDPTGYYFMEYLRASVLRMAIEMLRLPNSTLCFLMVMSVILRPTYSFRLHQEVAVICCISLGCLLLMLSVWAYAARVKRQLLPRETPQFLITRHHMELDGDAKMDLLREFTPPYKLQRQKSAWPGLFTRLLFGTTFPNKHQQLFFFWAKGPGILMRCFEASCFCQLIALAWWVQLFRSQPTTWITEAWWGNIVIASICVIQFALLSYVIYTVLIALNAGMLIDTELLALVWEIQRGESVRRTAELIDAIRIQSTLYAIQDGGEIFWRQLVIKSRMMSSHIQEQMMSMWAGLDEEHLGEINRTKIYRFLTSQGLTIKTEDDVNQFLAVFDRTKKGGLDQEEFFVMVIVVKQMLLEPLDKDAVRALFEERYGIPWSSSTGIDVDTLSRILNELKLVWSEGKKRYLLDFVGGKHGTSSVSADIFVSQLQAMEEQALQPLQQAAGEIQKKQKGGATESV